MSVSKEIFQNEHIVLPVIHAETENQVLDNARVAYEAGCDGIFLINMKDPTTSTRMSYENLRKLHKMVRSEYATWWIGVNYLDLPAVKVFENVDSTVSGVWVDNAEIYEWLDKQVAAHKILQARENSGWRGLYFGGVAFKYQKEVDNPGLAAKIATSFVDVVTTSGKATGSAPDLEKIRLMKESLGEFPLAIASGVSPENVKQFMPYADYFIVATSILVHGTENFDINKIKSLIDNVRG
ncbi:MAG TPA: BtpA/SgcQ family protein [Patescibacteria group bacterium]|nr:BtpA/SgcQ family protein [Patescibacteria group bacterium]